MHQVTYASLVKDDDTDAVDVAFKIALELQEGRAVGTLSNPVSALETCKYEPANYCDTYNQGIFLDRVN